MDQGLLISHVVLGAEGVVHTEDGRVPPLEQTVELLGELDHREVEIGVRDGVGHPALREVRVVRVHAGADVDVGPAAESGGGGRPEHLREFPFHLLQHTATQRHGRVLHRVDDGAAEPPLQKRADVLAGHLVRKVVRAYGAHRDANRVRVVLGRAVRQEELVRGDGPAHENVVVEVDEVLGESGNAVQLCADGMRVEDGEAVRLPEDLPVRHHGDALGGLVEPVRHLVVGDQVDVADPRGVHVQGTHRVEEFVAVDVAPGARGLLVEDVARSLGPASLPGRVVAVHPGVDDIDGKGDLVRPGADEFPAGRQTGCLRFAAPTPLLGHGFRPKRRRQPGEAVRGHESHLALHGEEARAPVDPGRQQASFLLTPELDVAAVLGAVHELTRRVGLEPDGAQYVHRLQALPGGLPGARVQELAGALDRDPPLDVPGAPAEQRPQGLGDPAAVGVPYADRRRRVLGSGHHEVLHAGLGQRDGHQLKVFGAHRERGEARPDVSQSAVHADGNFVHADGHGATRPFSRCVDRMDHRILQNISAPRDAGRTPHPRVARSGAPG